MKIKQYLFIFSIMMLLTIVMVGCSDDEQNVISPTKETVNNDTSKNDSTNNEEVTLTIGTFDNWYAPKSYTQNLPVFEEITKNTGVKLEWDVLPASQYTDAMKVRLAAGKNLPDIISIPAPSPVDAADDGLIIDLTDLIDQHAPNIKKFFEDFPEIENRMKTPDGKIYALSSVVDGAAYTDPYGLLINKKWLDNLGLEEPQTLDDWYEVLKAFKEDDPNGNGEQDEIPLSPAYGNWGLGLFGSALDFHLFYSKGFYPDDNGKIQYDWLKPEAKQLVTWLNKLYKEGLLDQEYLTKNDEQLFSDITRNKVGVSNHFTNNTSRYSKAQEEAGVADPNWKITVPPSGSGSKGHYEKYGPLSGWYAISKDAENPEAAIKWLDYIYANEEGHRLVVYGIEGKSYKMVDGEPQFTEWVTDNPDGLSLYEALRSLGAFPNLPYIRAGSGPLSKIAYDILELEPELVEQASRMEPYLVDNVPLGLATAEETKEMSVVWPDMETYVEESLAKFITDQSDIDQNWDQFVDTLNSMGIDQIIKIKQQQYDRVVQ